MARFSLPLDRLDSLHFTWQPTDRLKVSRSMHFPPLEATINSNCDSQHCNIMSRGGKHDKDMPDFMESKNARYKIENPGDVYNCAKCVDQAARDQPEKDPHRQGSQHLPDGGDAQPAHEEIDPGVPPARRADVKDLHDDPDQCQRPDDAQHAPFPKA